MHVAHFVQRYPPALGGSEAYFARLSRHLADRGEQVTVWTTDALDLEAFWDRRAARVPAGDGLDGAVAVRRFPLVHLPAQRWWLRGLALLPWRPWQCLTRSCNPLAPSMWRQSGDAGERYDLVHATAFPYSLPLVCALRLARRQKVPFVLTPFLHTGDPDDPNDPTRRAYTRPHLLWLARQADALLVQTEVERQALIEAGVSPEKLHIQGMGVDLASCTGGERDRQRREWGVGSHEMLVGHLANKSREKGTVDLLEAAERAWARGATFRMVLAGPEMANFRAFWERWPLAQRVIRLPVLTEEQKRDFFASLDVFALPSRSDSFGIVLLEAWANGAANVGYRAGGVAGVIGHEEDGLLVRCGDLDGLASALVRLEQVPALRCRLGQAGREKTLERYTWGDKLGLVHRLYHDLTARPMLPVGQGATQLLPG